MSYARSRLIRFSNFNLHAFTAKLGCQPRQGFEDLTVAQGDGDTLSGVLVDTNNNPLSIDVAQVSGHLAIRCSAGTQTSTDSYLCRSM